MEFELIYALYCKAIEFVKLTIFLWLWKPLMPLMQAFQLILTTKQSIFPYMESFTVMLLNNSLLAINFMIKGDISAVQ